MAAWIEAAVDCDVRAKDHAARRGQRDANAKGDRGDALDVNADELRGGPVLHGGTQAGPELCTIDKQVERSEQEDAQQEPEEIDVRNIEAADSKGAGHVPCIQLDDIGAKDLPEHPLDNDGDRVGHEDGEHGPVALEGPDEGPLEEYAKAKHEGHRDEEAEEQVNVPVLREDVAEVGAQDDQGALGDVDDLHHPEDQRQTGRHQGVDGASHDAKDDGFSDETEVH